MVPRRVIADSDDEDGDDNPLSPLREDEGIDPPEVEQLSPHHRPSSPDILDSHNHISDTTDQSFFASVYDEQQNRALHQFHLIENIVRQSQQASRSSGEISLPVKGKGKKADASSATNVTSPVVLGKIRNEPLLFSDGASGITTPRKSASGEWDVPSSAEDIMISKTTKSSKGKNEKSYGKRKRSQSKATKNSAAAEIFMGYDNTLETAQDTALHNEMLAPSHGVGSSLQPVFKQNEVLLDNSVIRDTAPIANFYIAQSNLTTMQKLEYEKVNVSQNGYPGLPGLPGPLTNIKSSGMSTVAYPTPSRYASSSGPPLPWERDSAADVEPDESVDFVNIMSSPDVIAGHDYTEGNPAEAVLVDTQVVHDEVEPPIGNTTPKSPYTKRKKRTRNILDEDEDELQDGPWDYEAVDRQQDKHKRRRNEPQLNPPSSHRDDAIELLPNPHEEILRDQDYQDLPKEEVRDTSDAAPEIPPTAPPPVPFDAPENNLPETQPIPQPKKRGRKKKQAVKEQTPQELPFENQAAAQEAPPAVKNLEVQIEPEKPKKKRGRPRKSDLAKPEIASAPEHELHITQKAHKDDAQHNEITLEKTEATEKPKPKKKQKARSELKKREEEDPTTDKEDVEDALKEINSNSKPSEEPVSAEEVPAKPTPKQLADQQKSNEKGSTVSKPTSTSSQPKVQYRVGLSKRTRIASLLKIIKK